MSVQAPDLPDVLGLDSSPRSRIQLDWPRALEVLALAASFLGVATFVLR
ncbi:MAG: hypothetical protein ABW360_18345 [Phenylobacterium sp.]